MQKEGFVKAAAWAQVDFGPLPAIVGELI